MGINEIIQIGNRIRELRIEKGYTQKEMARLTGIPYSTYSNYENNNREPNLEQLRKIASVLNISLFKLITTNQYAKYMDKDVLEYEQIQEELRLAKKISKRVTQFMTYYQDLNAEGQKKADEQIEQAIEQLKLLTKIPEYHKEPDAPPQE